jgi:hypothetical protein
MCLNSHVSKMAVPSGMILAIDNRDCLFDGSDLQIHDSSGNDLSDLRILLGSLVCSCTFPGFHQSISIRATIQNFYQFRSVKGSNENLRPGAGFSKATSPTRPSGPLRVHGTIRFFQIGKGQNCRQDDLKRKGNEGLSRSLECSPL